jgi:hypothetical protein
MSRLINVIILRLKLIYRDKATLILAIVITILMGLIIHTLYENIDEGSKIPIVFVDEDNSTISNKLYNNLLSNELLRTVKTSYKEGIKMLKNGEVQVVFLFNKGSEDKIWNSQLDKLINIYYISGNHMPLVLSDIVASEMLSEISVITAVNYLDKALGDVKNKSEILEKSYMYGNNKLENTKKGYYINVHYVNINKNAEIDKDSIKNDIIYKKIILGIILSFITLFTLFSTINIVKDREITIDKKIGITTTNNFIIIFGNYVSVVIASLLISTVFSLLLAFYSNNFLIVFLKIFIVTLFFVLAFVSLILFIASLFNKVSSFVVVGTTSIIILGIVSGSFFNIDMSNNILKNIAYLIPTYHTLNELMSIVVRSEFKNIQFYIVFMTMYSVILLTLITIKKLVNSIN